MPTKVDIANKALAAIGARSTIAWMDESSTEAQAVALVWDDTVADLLVAHRWPWAEQSVALALVADSGWPAPYSLAYARPADAVRVNQVVDADGYDWAWREAAQGRLLTDCNGAIARYTALIDDPSFWSARFVTAMVGRLAARLVVPLSGDSNLAKMAGANAAMALEAARLEAAQTEQVVLLDDVPDFIAVRSGGVRPWPRSGR